jgi:1-acyl-sn-glycerol-3-phosphate acyltransferase
MRRFPLADELPYQFYPPRIHALWEWVGRIHIKRELRRVLRVESIEVEGAEELAPLLARGDGVLITPNHSDNADAGVMFELGHRVRRPFYFMAAYQLFTGVNRIHLPRLGVFPVDREGADLRAFKMGVEILSGRKNPLVVFPEGEIYHTSDRLTPLREGAAALAVAAARKGGEQGRRTWIVPAAIKYRYEGGGAIVPALERLMAELEARQTWWPRKDRDLVERIYFYAEGMLALKELEYYGAIRHGTIKERIEALRACLLERIEDRRLGKRSTEDAPVRVKELRRACLDALAAPGVTADDADALRRDLNDLFVVVQLYSYPGDYVKECPTLERVAETLTKFEEDIFASPGMVPPRGPRRARVRLGPAIDVGAALNAAARPRHAAAALTAELEQRMQTLLDALGPGQPMPTSGLRRAPAGAVAGD